MASDQHGLQYPGVSWGTHTHRADPELDSVSVHEMFVGEAREGNMSAGPRVEIKVIFLGSKTSLFRSPSGDKNSETRCRLTKDSLFPCVLFRVYIVQNWAVRDGLCKLNSNVLAYSMR